MQVYKAFQIEGNMFLFLHGQRSFLSRVVSTNNIENKLIASQPNCLSHQESGSESKNGESRTSLNFQIHQPFFHRIRLLTVWTSRKSWISRPSSKQSLVRRPPSTLQPKRRCRFLPMLYDRWNNIPHYPYE